ncbi:MAG: rRNA maturation RNase YbeY [Candidatus Paceibacterota bacterium]|jgi:probable rRNA maturation factor
MLHIENETSCKIPSIQFKKIKDAILGVNYELTLVFTSSTYLKKLNTIYRDKEVSTDILSFPLSEKEGEIYICQSEAKKEAKKFGRTYENFLAFLFIHGCVHLIGYDHSSRMESIENKFRKKFIV